MTRKLTITRRACTFSFLTISLIFFIPDFFNELIITRFSRAWSTVCQQGRKCSCCKFKKDFLIANNKYLFFLIYYPQQNYYTFNFYEFGIIISYQANFLPHRYYYFFYLICCTTVSYQ